MTLPMNGSAERPSSLPFRSHCRTSLPERVNSTTVLSRLPVVLGSPCEPTPFWKPTKRRLPSNAMSSGPASGSVFRAPVPPIRNLWCSFLPNAICRTVRVWLAGLTGPALAGRANAPDVTSAPADTTAVASSPAVRLLRFITRELVRPASDAERSARQPGNERPTAGTRPDPVRLVKRPRRSGPRRARPGGPASCCYHNGPVASPQPATEPVRAGRRPRGMRYGVRTSLGLLAAACVAVTSAGCAGAPAPRPAQPVPMARGVVAIEPAADPRPLAAADTAFGLAVLRAWCAQYPGRNLVFSPSTLAASLGMAYLGARGATASLMARVLHLPAASRSEL